MSQLGKLWKKIQSNKITLFGTLAILGFLIVFSGYFLLKTMNNEEIDRNKIFLVGRDPNLYPITMMGKERNLSAFVNELIFKIASESKIKVRIINIPSNLLYDELSRNSVDAILTIMSPTATNRPNFLFSDPLFELGPVLVSRKNSNFRTLNDLSGKNVGIRRGDSLIFDQSGLGIFFIQYDSFLEGLEDLERNRIEAVFMPASAAYTYTHVFYPEKLKVATAPLREEGLRLQANKSLTNHYFIEAMNKGLKTSLQDGWYDSELIRWGLINPRKMSNTMENSNEG